MVLPGSIAACIYPIPEWIENKCKELLPFVLYKFMEIYEGFIEVQKISQEILRKKRASPKRGFIDKAGKWVIEPQFDSADDFHEGLMRVRM